MTIPRSTLALRARVVLVSLVALVTWTAERCGDVPVIRVLTPRAGLDVTYAPLWIEIDLWAFADLSTFQVELNGVDVTDAFVMDKGSPGRLLAHAPDVWGDGLVQPGTNDLVARVEQWQDVRTFVAAGDPYADAVTVFTPGTGAGGDPGVVLGPPHGLGLFLGGRDVLSLGEGGSIEVEFIDNVTVDGPGVDFTVFENPFLTLVLGFAGEPFAEPGRVSVSQDGVTWYVFDACHTAPLEPPYYPGCAGVFPTLSDPLDPSTPHPSIPTTTPIADLVGLSQSEIFVPEGSGGDSFDLQDVGLGWARFVRIEDVGPALGQAGTVGFDFDAVAAVHSGSPTDTNGNGVPDAAE